MELPIIAPICAGEQTETRGRLKMEVADWLDEAVQRAKKKYEIQRALEEKQAQEEAVKRKLGSQFCRELFAWLENMVRCLP